MLCKTISSNWSEVDLYRACDQADLLGLGICSIYREIPIYECSFHKSN